MKTGKGRQTGMLAMFAAVLLLIGLLLFCSRPAKLRSTSAPSRIGTQFSTPTTNKPEFARPQSPSHQSTNPVSAFLPIVNAFIQETRPFGLDSQISPESVVAWEYWGARKETLSLYTATHTFEFDSTRKRLRFFKARYDGTDTRADPNAEKQWYQATGRWSKDEALKETYAIMNRLNIRMDKVLREEYEPVTSTVVNPEGQRVTITPFQKVSIYGAQGTISAEFRMGSNGPGRLTCWSDRAP